MHGKPQRLRVNGEATVNDQDPLMDQTVGTRLIVRSHRTGNLPELSALHSDHAIGRTVSLRAASWMRGARTGLEGL